MHKKRGKNKMKIEKINDNYEQLKIIADWANFTRGTDPLIQSWKERVKRDIE
jgi:hypothetical protein